MVRTSRQATKNGKRNTNKWSSSVTSHSHALDLERDVFKSGNAGQLAASLKRSAEKSKRRKGSPFQSAMSMLNFYINRAGKNLPQKQKITLEKAKKKLRKIFHKMYRVNDRLCEAGVVDPNNRSSTLQIAQLYYGFTH